MKSGKHITARVRFFRQWHPGRKAVIIGAVGAAAAMIAAGSGVAISLTSSSSSAITGTTSMTNVPDTTSVPAGTPLGSCQSSSFGDVWATDQYPVVTLSATELTSPADTWQVTITSDGGRYLAFADPTNCTALESEGNINGSIQYTVTSATAPVASGLAPNYNGATAFSTLIDAFFAGTPTISGGDIYTYSYQNGNYTQVGTENGGLIITGDVKATAPVVLGVEGTTGQLYAQIGGATPGLGWQAEGGVITAAPAVVAAAGTGANGNTLADNVLFVATGTHEHLYMRTFADNWVQVPTALCLGGPGAYYNGTTLYVACEGTNKALYYNSTAWDGTGLPTFTTGWQSLGGSLTDGPTIAATRAGVTFFVRGLDNKVYTRTTTTGFTGTSWACKGAPAAAASGTDTVFACIGTDNALWEATNDGSGFDAAKSLGGDLTGTAGIGSINGPLFGESASNGAVLQFDPAGTVGGVAVGGVGAGPLN